MAVVAFIGQAVASAVIGKVVEKVASILEVSCFKGKELNHESRRKLKIVLLSAKAVLIDVGAKQISNPALKDWVRELTDAVIDAEDLLDKIDTESGTSPCQSTAESQTRKRKYSFISGFVDLFGKGSGSGSGSELQNILQRLEYITQQKDVLGLIQVVARDNEERENTDSEETNSDNEEAENSDNEETENSDSEETNTDNEEAENSDNEETENSDSEETNSDNEEAENSDNEETENSDSEETEPKFSVWILKYEVGENSDSEETYFEDNEEEREVNTKL